MKAFEVVANRTECRYARQTVLRFSDDANPQLSLAEHISMSSSSFAKAMEECATNTADAYVLELPAVHGRSIETLKATVHQVLCGYGGISIPATEVSPEDVVDPGYWFRWNGDRVFVLAFGPCFDASSSRFAFGRPETFILFQHENAFRRRHPAQIPEAVRESIRQRYESAGRGYSFDSGAVPVV